MRDREETLQDYILSKIPYRGTVVIPRFVYKENGLQREIAVAIREEGMYEYLGSKFYFLQNGNLSHIRKTTNFYTHKNAYVDDKNKVVNTDTAYFCPVLPFDFYGRKLSFDIEAQVKILELIKKVDFYAFSLKDIFLNENIRRITQDSLSSFSHSLPKSKSMIFTVGMPKLTLLVHDGKFYYFTREYEPKIGDFFFDENKEFKYFSGDTLEEVPRLSETPIFSHRKVELYPVVEFTDTLFDDVLMSHTVHYFLSLVKKSGVLYEGSHIFDDNDYCKIVKSHKKEFNKEFKVNFNSCINARIEEHQNIISDLETETCNLRKKLI